MLNALTEVVGHGFSPNPNRKWEWLESKEE